MITLSRRLQSLKARYGDLLKWTIEKSFHAKGVLGADYFLSGSMNLTLSGISVNGEHLVLRTDPAAVAEQAIELESRWEGLAQMIGVDVNAARAIKGYLSGLGDFNALGPDAASLCAKLIETVADPHFPGALVPSIDNSGNLHILIAASTMTAWRRLSPVLQGFRRPDAHLV